MTTTFTEDDLGSYLAAAGLGLTVGTNLILSLMPAAPDVVVSLVEYSGPEGDYVFGDPTANPLPALAYPKVQVVVRNPDYATARAKSWDIYKALSKIGNLIINGTLYERVQPLQDPFLMHRDEQRRVYHCCNFQITRTPVP